MSGHPSKQALCLPLLFCFLLASAGHAFAAKVQNRLFMKQFSNFVIGRLDSEASIRAEIRDFEEKNKDLVREGFGRHPELLTELYEKFGLVRMNCIEGRYFDMLNLKLNNEERHIFYDNARRLDWWVLQIAVEEADALGIRRVSPPLNFRLPSEIPYLIAKTIREELTPFAQAKLSPEDMKGLGYDTLECNKD